MCRVNYGSAPYKPQKESIGDMQLAIPDENISPEAIVRSELRHIFACRALHGTTPHKAT